MSDLHSPATKRILIVDDDVESRTMLALMMAGNNYSVTQATDGSEVIPFQRKKPFDLVIIELFLKQKDGFETLAELRRQPSSTKFIATAKSGWLPPEHFLQMALQLGAHHAMAKPFQAEEMLAAVRRILGDKKATAEN